MIWNTWLKKPQLSEAAKVVVQNGEGLLYNRITKRNDKMYKIFQKKSVFATGLSKYLGEDSRVTE